MQTIVTLKGQVTIPKAVRERAGLRPGDRVEIDNDTNGCVSIRAVPVDEADCRRLAGEARLARFDAAMEQLSKLDIGLGMTTDEFMATIREPVPL